MLEPHRERRPPLCEALDRHLRRRPDPRRRVLEPDELREVAQRAHLDLDQALEQLPGLARPMPVRGRERLERIRLRVRRPDPLDRLPHSLDQALGRLAAAVGELADPPRELRRLAQGPHAHPRRLAPRLPAGSLEVVRERRQHPHPGIPARSQRHQLRPQRPQLPLAVDHALRQPRRDLLQLRDSAPLPSQLRPACLELQPPLARQPLGVGQALPRVGDRRISTCNRGVDLAGAVPEQGPLEATLADARQAMSLIGRQRPPRC